MHKTCKITKNDCWSDDEIRKGLVCCLQQWKMIHHMHGPIDARPDSSRVDLHPGSFHGGYAGKKSARNYPIT